MKTTNTNENYFCSSLRPFQPGRILRAMEDFGISIRPYHGKKEFRIIDNCFAVRIAPYRYAFLPAGISVVFQRWNSGASSVALPELEPVWPDSYGPAIWVRSVKVNEIFRLIQGNPLRAVDRARFVRLAPWEDGPSLSVGDIVAINSGDGVVDFMRCESNGWNLLGMLNSD